jgi:hypothetical protein
VLLVAQKSKNFLSNRPMLAALSIVWIAIANARVVWAVIAAAEAEGVAAVTAVVSADLNYA